MKRTTIIVGAGAPLDFSLPRKVKRPTTYNITKEVKKAYRHFDGRSITIIRKIYNELKNKYPIATNNALDWKLRNTPAPNINFEMLFHVMELYCSYEKAWSKKCFNADIFPVFGLFTKPSVKIDIKDLHFVMMPFLQRIMDIVNDYNIYYSQNMDKESWYRDFFANDEVKWDVFNLNYDTTIEDSLRNYEDGFELISENSDVEHFNPQKLWANKRNWDTINHLHGCIRYYYPGQSHMGEMVYTMHDLFKYKDYKVVKEMMEGRAQSKPTTQDHVEYYGGPIVTGLRKPDKLGCVPYGFYHGHLYKCLLQNNSLVIVGYSFGDTYINNLIERMLLLHGEKTRVILIDYWNPSEMDEVRLDHFLEYRISYGMIPFLLKMSENENCGKLAQDIGGKGIDCPMYSKNMRLMVLSNGFKSATKFSDEIFKFLRS